MYLFSNLRSNLDFSGCERRSRTSTGRCRALTRRPVIRENLTTYDGYYTVVGVTEPNYASISETNHFLPHFAKAKMCLIAVGVTIFRSV